MLFHQGTPVGLRETRLPVHSSFDSIFPDGESRLTAAHRFSYRSLKPTGILHTPDLIGRATLSHSRNVHQMCHAISRQRFLIGGALLLCLLWTATAAAQRNAASANEEFVELNLTGSVALPQLVEAVSRQIDIRFLYSADLANRNVTIFTPAKLPKSALPVLLGSLLKGEDLAVVDSDVPGWKRIIDNSKMVPYAQPGDAKDVLQRDGPAAAVTQVIPVKNADISKLSQTLRPFLSKTGSSLIPLPEDKLIIVTDYARNVQRIVELLRLIDQPKGQAIIEFYMARNRTPSSLIQQADELLSTSDPKATTTTEVRLFNDASGRRVVVAGDKDRVMQTLRLLEQLDTGTDFTTKVYRPQNIAADRISKLIRGFVSSDDESQAAIETTLDQEGNLLIVRASADVHRQIETLLAELDQPVDSTESPIRFYKLRNANAVEVLYSLLALQQVSGSGAIAQAGGLYPGAFGTLGGLNVGGVNPGLGLGLQAAGIQGIGMQGLGMGFVPGAGAFPGMTTGNQVIRMPFDSGNADDVTPPSALQNQNSELGSLIGGGMGGGLGGFGGLAGGQVANLPGGARVSADVATNSLIVYAPANVQPLYERLIKSLDQRRPQVMIEADIIAVDTTDNFKLGVEISIGDRLGTKKLFEFTSFGLSEVNPTNGMLTPIPSLGFNGVLLDPDVADVIVQALSTHTRGRVLASPKILVNDNQTGTLESVASVPFNSVNTINTISTQSLGGDQQAGTIVTVTPHINEDDHLQLEFEVEFSAFVGEGIVSDDGVVLPPRRQIDRVGSVVTIPDGKTIVVGGLKQITDTNTFAGVPWVEKIPVLRELTSLTTDAQATTSFFLFIRPKILRDSRFRDLRYLSNVELQDAELAADYPESHPILIPCPTPPTPRPMHHNNVQH